MDVYDKVYSLTPGIGQKRAFGHLKISAADIEQ